MNTLGKISVSQMAKFRELLNRFGDPLSPNFKELQVSDATVYGCVGYLDNRRSDQVNDVVIDADETERGFGWIVLILVMMFVVLAGVCLFALKCETVTHKPLTTDKKKKKTKGTDDGKDFIERKVYGVITTAGVKEAVNKADDAETPVDADAVDV